MISLGLVEIVTQGFYFLKMRNPSTSFQINKRENSFSCKQTLNMPCCQPRPPSSANFINAKQSTLSPEPCEFNHRPHLFLMAVDHTPANSILLGFVQYQCWAVLKYFDTRRVRVCQQNIFLITRRLQVLESYQPPRSGYASGY